MEDTTTPSSSSPHPPPHDHDHDHDQTSYPPNKTHPLPRPPHAIIRLIQCSRCSLPLRSPLRLPCGNTVCRSCLPPVRPRSGITYPVNEDRKLGFKCYWKDTEECAGEHCIGDCGADVLLGRLGDVFGGVLGGQYSGVEADVTADGNGNGDVSVSVRWKGSGLQHESAEIGSDRLKGIYGLVTRGGFDYDASEVEYTCLSEGLERLETQEGQTFGRLKEAVRSELDCQVCYSLILDPLTTGCGHTFCRGCVAMVMDHSDLCPVCRRKLDMSATVRFEPINRRILELVGAFFPEQVVARREGSATATATAKEGQRKIPLFVSALSFPTMPTFLHVFEPRYRIMIQKVMRSRDKKFGMVMHNRAMKIQPGLGRSQFMQYGTVLLIERYELLPDGRSLVIASGVSRFKVLGFELVDGYHLGTVQRVDDIPIAEEERQESVETSASAGTDPASLPLESMPTQQLFQMALDFVDKNRLEGASWLQTRVRLAYGEAPSDPALFPWWFATVLPQWEDEKYLLLSTTSVRERLKIVAQWVKKSESQEWLARARASSTPVL
ncbi:ATP-dependent protease [Aspergillus heteromorphus CBS 117.55]|uniref:ATP-dependent protease n=1 Tax=Aspergillus heteromorphus CBS 117.55 TaxID=1448321 RepID=A0A317VKD5_9EURO|nr:ATP-dependent protease [Aspergillus heteromorphus CBS 117.55]PWY73671.1 ATP-dependent protease [Aspergillus heteromorphus CBS 117.55]